MERMRMVFTGSGGQGVITAAIIFAEAAVIYEGLNATQSQAYGAAARGGSTRSDIIISEEEINFPKVIQPNMLVCLTQESYNSLRRLFVRGAALDGQPLCQAGAQGGCLAGGTAHVPGGDGQRSASPSCSTSACWGRWWP